MGNINLKADENLNCLYINKKCYNLSLFRPREEFIDSVKKYKTGLVESDINGNLKAITINNKRFIYL